MTDLRTAAQQALEALEDMLGWQSLAPQMIQESAKGRAYALRAALAEPVQEPVAWRWGYRSITTGEMDWRGYVEIAADPNLRSPAIIMQPLYAAPPQRPAEPVQEPVAWTLTRTLTERKTTTNGYLWFSDPVNSSWTPLYTAPPQRKPLTDEEIYILFWTAGSPTAFARAIERAHGIKETALRTQS